MPEPERIVAEYAVLVRLLYSHFQAVHRNRIFRADVDNTVRRADGIARYHHRLDDCVRVALEQRPVHERAGVALVRITYDVLLVALRVVRELPFQSRGKARAASAAQTALFYLVDDLLRGHG